MAVLKPVQPQDVPEIKDENTVIRDSGAAVENMADADNSFDDNTVVCVDMPVYQGYSSITDDTSEMTVYSTNATAPAIALLSFVNSTRPGRAAWDGAVKEADGLLYDFTMESMAA